MPALHAAHNVMLGSAQVAKVYLGPTALWPSRPAVLGEAVFWIDAANSVQGEQVAVNQGTGGSVLDARYGSTTGADTNDPLFLPHDGESYVYFPEATGNTATIPYESAMNVVGDFEVVSRCEFSASSAATICGREQAGSTPGRTFNLMFVSASPRLNVANAAGAVAQNQATASLSSVGYVTGDVLWIKSTFTASTGVVRFYYADDQAAEPSEWTQLGADVASGINDMRTSDSLFEIGSRVTNQALFQGRIYAIKYRNGIGGSEIVDIDCPTDITDAGATSFTATSGQTVTVNRSTSGRKTALVTRPIWLFGTDDYLEVPDNDLLDLGAGDDLTVLLIARLFPTVATAIRLVRKQSGGLANGIGWCLSGYPNTAGMGTFDQINGFKQALPPSMDDPNVLRTVVGVRKGTASGNANETTLNGLFAVQPLAPGLSQDISNTAPMQVGRDQGSYANMEVVAAAVWRRALTTEEIAALNSYYGTV